MFYPRIFGKESDRRLTKLEKLRRLFGGAHLETFSKRDHRGKLKSGRIGCCIGQFRYYTSTKKVFEELVPACGSFEDLG